MRKNTTFRMILGVAMLGIMLPVTACSSSTGVSHSQSASPSANESVTSGATQATPTEEPTPEFKHNAELSDQQNAFVQQIMAINGYTQSTAEAVLALGQSVCRQLDESDPSSKANEEFLSAMFQANGTSSDIVQEWYNNALISAQTMCPEKTAVVQANRPQGATDPTATPTASGSATPDSTASSN